MRCFGFGILALLLSCTGRVSIGANQLESGGTATSGGAPGGTGGSAPSRGGSAGMGEGGRVNGGGAMPGLAGSGGAPGTGGAMPDGGAAATPGVIEGCAQQLASGDHHVCVLFEDGRVACQGANGLGQLGIGKSSESEPLVLSHAPVARLIAAGGDHTCVTPGGSVVCWGDNARAALGVPETELSFDAEPRSVPLSDPLALGAQQLALGRHHGCVLDGFVHGRCWGGNERGEQIFPPQMLGQIGLAPLQVLQLGNGELRLIDSERLYDVAWAANSQYRGLSLVRGASTGVVQNSVGPGQDCLLKRSGIVFCRGNGYPDFYSAVVDFGHDVVELRAGGRFTCVRTSAGKVLCRDALAAPEPSARVATPVDLDGVVELSLGQSHACARLQDGSVWCWGALLEGAVDTPPTRIVGPAPQKLCMGMETPPLWDRPRPPARPVDFLSDAALSWGQNQCRCALKPDAPEQPLEGCAIEETTVLNGCLQALAPLADGEEVTCRAEALWSLSVCSLRCLDTGALPLLEECLRAWPTCPTSASTGVVDFCLRRRLPCDEGGSKMVDATRTCDGVRDCDNGFDEANCVDKGVFTCADGSTIALDRVHDGVAQCGDSSDEWGR